VLVHRVQEVVHFGQQPKRVIKQGASTLPEAFNEDFLPGNAAFLLRHMPDAHLQFCFTCPHGDPQGQSMRRFQISLAHRITRLTAYRLPRR
jgi:hypothetical protein